MNNYPIVSSNTLFHFTGKMEHLIGILENTFEARYSLEKLDCIFPEEVRKNYWSIAIPMTCFCDLPLSNTSKHLAMYGGYGIGLTKEWGMKKGLSPILYTHSESPTKKAVRASVSSMVFSLTEDNKKLDQLTTELMDFICFTKPYEGDFLRRGKLIEDVRFYDEREWRFVPEDSLRLSHKDFENSDVVEQSYKYLGNSRKLHFTPDDIRYIVVKEEKEILPMVEHIDRIKTKFSKSQRDLLKTRIISSEQIRDDF